MAKEFFTRAKRPDLEVNLSLPCSAKVKNEWSYTPATLRCLNEVERKNSGQ
jgi:hypothetical protein